MAESTVYTENKTYEASPTIQHLRELAQANLNDIQAEDSAEAVQQAAAMHELQKYTKVKRKDRPKATVSPTPPETKGAKLRSAQDVLDRLRHDPGFDIAEYCVGYLERFEGIKEMPVTSWISESTDEEWIPQHRIRYVKRVKGLVGDEVVWDREKRVDKVFGSGNVVMGEDDRDESVFGGAPLEP